VGKLGALYQGKSQNALPERAVANSITLLTLHCQNVSLKNNE